MNAVAVPPPLPSSLQQARAIREAEELLRHPGATVSVVGDKPWYQRVLSKFRGPASVLLFYATAAASFSLGPKVPEVGHTPDPKPAAQVTIQDVLNQNGFLMSPVELKPLFAFQNGANAAAGHAAFDVPEAMSSQQVAQKLFEVGKPFQALAVTLEGLETKPYRDGCGLNVGMGYCIDARVREYGTSRIRQDLLNAGLSTEQTDVLMGNDKKAQLKVELTRTQALALLSLTEGDYRTRARDLIGQKVFDALPSNRQAVMTWLSYNTGDGLARFNRLLTAVRQDRTSDAVQHMTPFFSQGGTMVPNARAGSWLMAAYWSNDAMKTALDRPDALEHGSRQGRSPLEVVAPKEAGRLALRGTLPQSPYVAHGLAGGTSPAPVAPAAPVSVVPAPEAHAPVAMPTPSDWRSQRQATPVGPTHGAGPAQDQPQVQPNGLNPQDLLENLPSTPRRSGLR